MAIWEQGMRTCSCTRIGKDVLQIRSVFLSTKEECSAWMDCDVHSFQVLDGGWEIQRTMGEIPCASGNLDVFCGTEAHFEAGLVIRDLPGVPEPIKELLRECVRGIVQAESYLTEERGYASPEEQDAEFTRLYGKGCRFYAYPDAADVPWSVFIGSYRRKEGLFHRYKSYVVSGQEKGIFQVSGTFCDSFHEIHLEFAVNSEEGCIQEARAEFLRAPGRPCFDCAGHAEKLSGMQASISKRELGALLGGAEGCSHLVDLAGEIFGVVDRLIGKS